VKKNKQTERLKEQKSLIVSPEMSYLSYDPRIPRRFRIFGNPPLYFDLDRKKLVINENPDGDSLFADVHDFSLFENEGGFKFWSDFSRRRFDFRVSVSNKCDKILINFIKRLMKNEFSFNYDVHLVFEIYINNGICEELDFSYWMTAVEFATAKTTGVINDLIDSARIFRSGGRYIYLVNRPVRIKEEISSIVARNDGIVCELKNNTNAKFKCTIPEFFVELINDLIAASVDLSTSV
jgi:hypothetical protein